MSDLPSYTALGSTPTLQQLADVSDMGSQGIHAVHDLFYQLHQLSIGGVNISRCG